MTINQKLTLLIIGLFWALPNFVSAQNNDTRLRLSAKIQKEITDKFRGSLEYEHRFDQQLTTFDKAFLEPALSYQILKPLRVGVLYRVMLDQNKIREQKYKQRIAGFIRYDFDVDDFEIKFKTALQYGFDEITNASFFYDQKLINRNSVEIEYKIFGSKFTPFISYELFYHINHPNGGITNQWRLKTGSAYQLNKKSRIQFYYLFEDEFNVANPVDAHIFGFGYSCKF